MNFLIFGLSYYFILNFCLNIIRFSTYNLCSQYTFIFAFLLNLFEFCDRFYGSFWYISMPRAEESQLLFFDTSFMMSLFLSCIELCHSMLLLQAYWRRWSELWVFSLFVNFSIYSISVSFWGTFENRIGSMCNGGFLAIFCFECLTGV